VLPNIQQSHDNQIQMVKGDLPGQVLKERYLIGRHIDNGSFGQVFKIIDLKDQSRPLVIKISADYKLFGKEINSMKKSFKKSQEVTNDTMCSTPEVIEYGMIIQSTECLQL
jgi:hypothetical protein